MGKAIGPAPSEPVVMFLIVAKGSQHFESDWWYCEVGTGTLMTRTQMCGYNSMGSTGQMSTYICDHLASGLVPLSVVGPFLFLLQDALAGGTVLQRKLAQNLTEAVHTHVAHGVRRVAQEQQEGMEPGRTTRHMHERTTTGHGPLSY